MTVTTDQIKAWFDANPNASDAQVTQTMKANGVTAQQYSDATGIPLDKVMATEYAGTTLPVWANKDQATYQAMTGLDPALMSQAPKSLPTKTIQAPIMAGDPENPTPTGKYQTVTQVDTSKLPAGVTPIYDSNDNLTGYSTKISTPSGWDSAVKLQANYDTNGNLSGYSGSNPVFPADTTGTLSKTKFDPIWSATGQATPQQDTSTGGWALTAPIIQGLSMNPVTAPFMAAGKVLYSLANGQKISATTLINAGIAAVGAMGGTPVDQIPNEDGTITTTYSDGSSSTGMPTQGIAGATLAQTLGDVKTGINVGTAIQSKNVTALLGDLAKLTNTSSDYQVALTAANAAKALMSGQPLSAISPYITAMVGSSDPNAASMAKTMLSTIQADIAPTTSETNVNVDTTPKTGVNVDTTIPTTPTTPTAPTTTPTTAPAAKDPLAVPLIPNALALPTPGFDTSGNRVAVPTTIGAIKELDLNKLFDVIDSSNPSENTTITAKSGGSINDLVQLLNSRG